MVTEMIRISNTNSASMTRQQSIVTSLASTRLCFYLLAVLIAWLLGGIFLDAYHGTRDAIFQMNNLLILDWLIDPEPSDWRVIIWFVGFCIINGLLFINLICCTAISMQHLSWNRCGIKKLALLTIHILMALIMLGHVADMVVGYKYSHIKLTPGKSYPLPDGYCVRLDHVTYKPSLDILTMKRHDARKLLTREKFKIKENYSKITVTQKNQILFTDNVFMLAPLNYNGLRITLNKFFLAKKKTEKTVGAVITLARNPVHEIFFIIYALMIVTLIVYTVTKAYEIKI